MRVITNVMDDITQKEWTDTFTLPITDVMHIEKLLTTDNITDVESTTNVINDVIYQSFGDLFTKPFVNPSSMEYDLHPGVYGNIPVSALYTNHSTPGITNRTCLPNGTWSGKPLDCHGNIFIFSRNL